MIDILAQVSINPKTGISLAHQIKLQIMWLIASGALAEGDRLPSVRKAAQRLCVNLHTVRSAYRLLELDGLVEIRQGRETRVVGMDPGRVARAVTNAPTKTVGVIIAGFDNPFYHQLIRGITGEADRDQTLLLVGSSRDDPNEAWRYFHRLSNLHVDGVIIVSHSIDEYLFGLPDGIHNSPAPIPYLTVDSPDATGPVVLADLWGAGFQATAHLAGRGHRRIGMVTFLEGTANVQPLEEGYVEALKQAGIPYDPDLLVRTGAFDAAAGEEGAYRLAKLPEPPSAIFAITDLMAAGAIQALQSMGKRIPQDVSVVGVDDIPEAALLDPPLTTVSLRPYELGITSMRMLRRVMEGKGLPQPRVIQPAELVVRQSTARCG